MITTATILSGVAQGLIWAILTLGVYLTFRILDIADLTVEGTFPLGAAVTVVLINTGMSPAMAMLCALTFSFLKATDLKIITAVIVAFALALPVLQQKSAQRKLRRENAKKYDALIARELGGDTDA